jgi:prefoldin subunit 2
MAIPESELSREQISKLQMEYEQMSKEKNALMHKINELQQEVREHKLVEGVFDTVEADRKAWRLVGGVLVQRTVKDIQPQIVENREKIEGIVGTLTKQLETKSKQVAAFEQKYGQKRPAAAAQQGTDDTKQNSGVLV